MRISSLKINLLLPILSGFFVGTSYIPFPPWASLFCFVPLWIFWLKQENLKQVLIGGFATSFVFTLIGFNWITYLLHEFANAPWPMAFLGMLGFALIAHLFVPAAGALWFLLKNYFQWNRLTAIFALGIITAFFEYLSFTLFDWNFGYPWFSSGLPIYQLAELIGFSGLSMLTIGANIPAFIIWQNRKDPKLKLQLAAFVLVFAGLNLWGYQIGKSIPEADKVARVLVVQANIGNLQKKAVELGRGRFRGGILDSYLELTSQGLNKFKNEKGVDFVVWPETAYPDLMGENFKYRPLHSKLRRFFYDQQTPLVTGAYSISKHSGLSTNSLFALDSDGEISLPYYSKSILLAFGEYIPGEKVFPGIRKLLPPTGHFEPGPGPTVLLKVGDLKIGPQICYESLFSRFSKRLADLGAQVIVNVTNDSWYGGWQQPYQHMYMTLARAIEVRRPVIRSTNTGISTAVTAKGEILQRSPIYNEWYDLLEVPYLETPQETFYQKWYWLMPSLLLLSLLTLLGTGLRERIRKH